MYTYVTLVFYIPEDGNMIGQNCTCKTNFSVLLCAFVSAIILYIQLKQGLWIT
jgi:hypothetical protein